MNKCPIVCEIEKIIKDWCVSNLFSVDLTELIMMALQVEHRHDDYIIRANYEKLNVFNLDYFIQLSNEFYKYYDHSKILYKNDNLENEQVLERDCVPYYKFIKLPYQFGTDCNGKRVYLSGLKPIDQYNKENICYTTKSIILRMIKNSNISSDHNYSVFMKNVNSHYDKFVSDNYNRRKEELIHEFIIDVICTTMKIFKHCSYRKNIVYEFGTNEKINIFKRMFDNLQRKMVTKLYYKTLLKWIKQQTSVRLK